MWSVFLIPRNSIVISLLKRRYGFGLFLLSCLLGWAFSLAPQGKGKAAYRNYFLGNYYYQEGKIKKAAQHFRQAYQAIPVQTSFALAYALSTSINGNSNEGLQVLAAAANDLQPSVRDYAAKRTMFAYVQAIVETQAGYHSRAKRHIDQAIRLQEALPEENYQRMAGMYNLAAFLSVMDQEMPKAHAGLKRHVHLQKAELEQAFPRFLAALALDSSRKDIRNNLQLLADTLGQTYTVQPLQQNRTRRLRYPPGRYTNLPDRMEELIPFGQYDELLFLVDISGSMVMEQVGCTAADRFTVMKEAAQFLVDNLPEHTRAGLATIGGDCGTEPTWWIPTDSLNHRDLRFQLRHLNSDGTTPLLTTLVDAPVLFSDHPTTTKAIFFVSDGENVCSLPGVDICDWANKLANQQIELNVLTFLDQNLSNSGAFAEYACLSDRSGGRVRYLNPVACSIDDFQFDLVDKVTFELPPLERVNCWGPAIEKMWAVYPEK